MSDLLVIAKFMQIAFFDSPERDDITQTLNLPEGDKQNFYDGCYLYLNDPKYFEVLYNKYYEQLYKISVHYTVIDQPEYKWSKLPSERWIKHDTDKNVWTDAPLMFNSILDVDIDLPIRNTTSCICHHINDVFKYPKWITLHKK